MSLDNRKDFYGKEVAEAIRKACEEFSVSQEKLDIEVVETGSTGIFGLIRKKAHIRASLKQEKDAPEDLFEVSSFFDVGNRIADSESREHVEPKNEPVTALPVEEKQPQARPSVSPRDVDPDDDDDEDESDADAGDQQVTEENLELVRQELLALVGLMGFPAELEMESKGLTVKCRLRGEFEENLTGHDGKVLDSIQYLLRKIVSRKTEQRLRINVNAGDFRERRLEELKARAVELAALVKADGKTQVIPALNPSERREIHMVLQDDKEIRSRSVGDGIFKKILIYKPGKGNRSGGRKRPQGKGRHSRGGGNRGRSES